MCVVWFILFRSILLLYLQYHGTTIFGACQYEYSPLYPRGTDPAAGTGIVLLNRLCPSLCVDLNDIIDAFLLVSLSPSCRIRERPLLKEFIPLLRAMPGKSKQFNEDVKTNFWKRQEIEANIRQTTMSFIPPATAIIIPTLLPSNNSLSTLSCLADKSWTGSTRTRSCQAVSHPCQNYSGARVLQAQKRSGHNTKIR